MEENKEYIYMYCEAQTGEEDWYGDYDYLPTELNKFCCASKLWEYKTEHNYSCHGYGCPGVAVKTTMEALKIMGWEDLYEKYKTTEEKYNNIRE